MKSFSAIIFLIVMTQSTYADEISHRKLAEELFALTNASKNVEDTLSMVREMQINQLNKMNIPAEASEQIKSMQMRITDLIADELKWEKLKEDYLTVYADTFTEEEIQGILKFYKSPVGNVFLKKTPDLTKRLMAVTQKQVEKLMPKIQDLIKKMMEDLKAARKEKSENSQSK